MTAEGQPEPPIVSNITRGEFDVGEVNEDSNSDNINWSEEDGEDLDPNAGWDTPVEADEIPLLQPEVQPPAMVIGSDEENPCEEGVIVMSTLEKPMIAQNNKGDPKQRCWICENCHAINNMLESFQKYNLKCCMCRADKQTHASVIFSHDWDPPKIKRKRKKNKKENEDEDAENNSAEEEEEEEEEEEVVEEVNIYQVWYCPFCTYKNDMTWLKCQMCQHIPNDQELELMRQYCYDKPIKVQQAPAYVERNVDNNVFDYNNNNNNNNNNDNKRKRGNARKPYDLNHARRPRIHNIGIPCGLDNYPPVSAFTSILEPRLVDIFGKPYTNPFLVPNTQNEWSRHHKLLHSELDWTSNMPNEGFNFRKEHVVSRGFALNPHTGWLAIMTRYYIFVFKPIGGCEFQLHASYVFPQALDFTDLGNSRLRFVGYENRLFAWSFERQCVYAFKVIKDSNVLMLVDTIKDDYFKTSQATDIIIVNDLLIILFDRWLGAYKMYPELAWYHAIAFATKTVNCFSVESAIYDGDDQYIDEEEDEKASSQVMKRTNNNYMFVNTEDQLVGLHPVNPTFDFLHVARDAKQSKCKYCISKRYGVFYLANDGKSFSQSPHLYHKSNLKCLDLNWWSPHNNVADHGVSKQNMFQSMDDFHHMRMSKGIEKFLNIQYDEMYGISGRLLVLCQMDSGELAIHQFVNWSDFDILIKEIRKPKFESLQFATGLRSFNFVVAVYTMLYGVDVIDMLLQSEKFNPKLQSTAQDEHADADADVDEESEISGDKYTLV